MTLRTRKSTTNSGFTLIEIIAVMAILAILASAIVPNIASQLKRARADAEDVTLANLSKLIAESVVRNHAIPGTGTWAQAVATLSDQPLSNIATNQDAFARVFVVDPGWLPVGTRPPAAGWTQTQAGSWGLSASVPSRCRILLISGSQQDLTGPCAGLNAAQFDQVWNAQAGPAACMEGDNVRIGRVNLTSLFHLVTISSTMASNGGISFSPPPGLPTPAPQAVGAGSTTIPVLQGTRVSLMIGPLPQTDFVVNSPVSASWDGTNWTGP